MGTGGAEKLSTCWALNWYQICVCSGEGKLHIQRQEETQVAVGGPGDSRGEKG